MLTKLIREKYYCGLDIGANTIKAVVVKVKKPDTIEWIGRRENKTYGFRNSCVDDMGVFSECIHNTLQPLLKDVKLRIRDVQVGIGSDLIDVRSMTTAIPLTDKGSKVISRRDIKKINDQSRLLGVKIDEEILHSLPRHYKVDDVNSVVNPLGLYGRKLGVCSLLVVSPETRLRNIAKAVHQAGYDVGPISFNSYVAADKILTEEEKNEGSVFVDIGSARTGVFVFHKGRLKFFDKVEKGGRTFSQKIASSLDMPFDLAEEIKKSHATVSSSARHYEEEILIKRENGYVPLKRKSLFEVIDPMVVHLTDDLRLVLEKSGCYEHLSKGVVLIGGGALLPGLIERVSDALRLPVRLGTPPTCSTPGIRQDPIFASVFNVALSGHKPVGQDIVVPKKKLPWTQMVAEKTKELYHEYF